MCAVSMIFLRQIPQDISDKHIGACVNLIKMYDFLVEDVRFTYWG